MQDQLGTWSIRTPTAGITTSAATPITAVQYAASSSNTAEVLYFSISQSASTTSAMEQVRLIRKTAAATVTIGAVGTNIFDATGNSTGGAGTFRGTLSTSATGVVGSAEGTDGDEFFRWDFNVLSGYERDFQPNHRLWVPPSGIIAVKIKAVLTGTYNVTLVIRESK
jgi:hypothetical protein